MKKTIVIVFAVMLVCLGLGGCASSPNGGMRKAVNKTPEQLAQKVLESLRDYNREQYISESLFTKQQAQQYARQLQNVLPVVSEAEAFPWLEEWDQCRQNNIASWERILSQGTQSGITWSNVAFVRAECELKEHNGICAAPEIGIVFSSNGALYRIMVDDCFKTQDGWLAADALHWQGRAD